MIKSKLFLLCFLINFCVSAQQFIGPLMGPLKAVENLRVSNEFDDVKAIVLSDAYNEHADEFILNFINKISLMGLADMPLIIVSAGKELRKKILEKHMVLYHLKKIEFIWFGFGFFPQDAFQGFTHVEYGGIVIRTNDKSRESVGKVFTESFKPFLENKINMSFGDYVTIPESGRMRSAYTFGNVESLFDGTLMVGDAQFTDAEFENYAKQMKLNHLTTLKIKTNHFAVGHVDQSIKVMPSHNKENDLCPVSIMSLDTGKGIDLLRTNLDAEIEYYQADQFYIDIKNRSKGIDLSGFRSLVQFRELLCAVQMKQNLLGKNYSKTQYFENSKYKSGTRCSKIYAQDIVALYDQNIVFRELNVRAQKNQKDNVKMVKDDLTSKIPSCANLKVVSIPNVLIPTGKKSGIELFPNIVNSVYYKGNLFHGLFGFQPYEDYLLKEFEKVSLKPVKMNDRIYHYMGGGVHCATNLLRSKSSE